MTAAWDRAVAICVPVRNEAALLPALLDAIAAQVGGRDARLCLFLDNCSDASAAIVARRALDMPCGIVVESGAADGPPNPGRARRQAMAIGERLLSGRRGAALISTDADTLPAPDWLGETLAALDHADVVAGRVRRAADWPNALQDRVEAYLDALFALRRAIDPVPWEAATTHHYASAASLAFRLDAYRALGGFAPVADAEDGLIVDAAHRAGLRVRRDARVNVVTSSRRDGRAQHGLAGHLRRLDAGSAAAPYVAHPDDVAWRFRGHAAARACWQLPASFTRLARLLGCDPAHIGRVASIAGNAESFAIRVVPDVAGGERLVTLEVAEQALAGLIGDLECRAA